MENKEKTSPSIVSTWQTNVNIEERDNSIILIQGEQSNQTNPYTKSNCRIKQNRAEALAKHNEAIHQTNKEMLEQKKIGNTYSVNSNLRNTKTDVNVKGGAGGKFFADCPKLSGNTIQDKFFVITKSAGEDYNLAYSELVGAIRKDLLKEALSEQIGSLQINTTNKFRDNPGYKTKYFEYLLLNGQTLKNTDYPELASYFGVTKDSFKLPDMSDGTFRNLKQGNGRANGSFQEDAMQKMTGEFGMGRGTHGDKTGFFFRRDTIGVFANLLPDDKPFSVAADLKNGLSDRTSTIIFDNSLVARTDSETRMKNMGVQVYICAKVLI